MRSHKFLSSTVSGKYAFIGIGNHSIQNLYPVLDHLQVPLKYICCTSEKKAQLITNRYINSKGITDINTALQDPEIKGILASTSSSSHYKIAQAAIESGKHLFIEKPPCRTLKELEHLIELQSKSDTTVLVGVQKRYAPAVQKLRHRLKNDSPISYQFNFHTGLFPEGNPVLELFIHPIDLAYYLFGEAKIEYQHTIGNKHGYTLTLIIQHNNGTIGNLNLSTAHSWVSATENISINTPRGEYFLDDMETLTFSAKQKTIMGIPTEKVMPKNKTVEYIYNRNNFNPVMFNNQIHSQGYFNELNTYIENCEGKSTLMNHSTLKSLLPTYKILEQLKGSIA